MWPNEWYQIFQAVSIVAAMFTFIGLTGAVLAQLEINKRSRVQVSTLELQVAEQQQRTATAQLETERLKAQFAWRVIPPDTVAQLEKNLAAHPGSVNLQYIDGDPESLYLAIQIVRILEKAQWKVASSAPKFAGALIFGFRLPDTTGPDAQTLRQSFSAAGLSFSTDPIPQAIMSVINAPEIKGAPTLLVGSKAPPLP